MPLKIHFTKESLDDLDSQVANLAEFSLNAALEFRAEVREKLEQIAAMPNSQSAIVIRKGKPMRRFVLKSRTVFYAVLKDEIRVARVFGPGEDWQKRH